MYAHQIYKITDLFLKNGLFVTMGMDEEEISAAQKFYGIVFPPDLKKFLMTVSIESNNFYNWNDYSRQNIEVIKKALARPVESALFDVEHNNFWLEAWGTKPEDLMDKLLTAKKHMDTVPKLIPIYQHRYISSFPLEEQNPVYSVGQLTDTIFYGRDLLDYFEIEFGVKKWNDMEFDEIKPIPFWHDIITSNGSMFRRLYLNADTWESSKDGAPLFLLDNLTPHELEMAEQELISAAGFISPVLGHAKFLDSWPIIGLGHIRSQKSLPVLYSLLEEADGSRAAGKNKVIIAHSIFQICSDKAMIPIVSRELAKIAGLLHRSHGWDEFDLIEILYMLPDFQDAGVNRQLSCFMESENCLIAYNAAKALGLPTDPIDLKFKRNKNSQGEQPI